MGKSRLTACFKEFLFKVACLRRFCPRVDEAVTADGPKDTRNQSKDS